MRIDNATPVAVPTTASISARAHSRRNEDRVHLSVPASTPEKVDRIAAAVQAGTYRVPAMQIAASIIRETLADYH